MRQNLLLRDSPMCYMSLALGTECPGQKYDPNSTLNNEEGWDRVGKSAQILALFERKGKKNRLSPKTESLSGICFRGRYWRETALWWEGPGRNDSSGRWSLSSYRTRCSEHCWLQGGVARTSREWLGRNQRMPGGRFVDEFRLLSPFPIFLLSVTIWCWIKRLSQKWKLCSKNQILLESL